MNNELSWGRGSGWVDGGLLFVYIFRVDGMDVDYGCVLHIWVGMSCYKVRA